MCSRREGLWEIFRELFFTPIRCGREMVAGFLCVCCVFLSEYPCVSHVAVVEWLSLWKLSLITRMTFILERFEHYGYLPLRMHALCYCFLHQQLKYKSKVWPEQHACCFQTVRESQEFPLNSHRDVCAAIRYHTLFWGESWASRINLNMQKKIMFTTFTNANSKSCEKEPVD